MGKSEPNREEPDQGQIPAQKVTREYRMFQCGIFSPANRKIICVVPVYYLVNVSVHIPTKMKPAREPHPNWSDKVQPDLHCFFEGALTDENYKSLAFFREQCSFLANLSPSLKCPSIANFFGVDPKTVWVQLQKAATPRRPNGRPPVLPEEQASAVLTMIDERCACHDPPTVCEILNFVWDNFAICVLPNTLRKWINSSTRFKTVRSRPMEDTRLRTTTEQLAHYFEELSHAIDDVPSALIFNLDESGFQRFIDAKHETIVVPEGGQERYHSVSRREKRATFLLTVAADGRTVRPLLIVPRLTIEAEILLAGYGEDQCVFVHSQNGYITRDIFERYIRDVFIPYVNVRRSDLGYNGWSVLTMDQCSCHCGETIRRICEENGVRLVYLPPHSSDQAQACDLGLFGNLKAAQSRIHAPEEMTLQSRQVIRIISAFQATRHPLAITSAFRRAGISNFLNEGRLYARVTPCTCSAIRNPLPKWNAETPPERFDKSRIELGDGLWGLRADRWLTECGVYTFAAQVPDADSPPESGGEQGTATIIDCLEEVELSDSSDSEDCDWLPEAECQNGPNNQLNEMHGIRTNPNPVQWQQPVIHWYGWQFPGLWPAPGPMRNGLR